MGQVFVRASRRAKAHVRKSRKGAGGWSRIVDARGGGGTKKFGVHAFEITTRGGVKKTIFRRGKYSDVAKSVKRLQNRMKGGVNHITYLP